MKYCFIINPAAGKGHRVEEVVENIKSVSERMSADYDVFTSDNIDATREYIRAEAASAENGVGFIACGGDGTLCETISAVMELDGDIRSGVRVGVIPMGTGNDFVSNFDPKETFFDIEAQLNSEEFEIDLIRCNDMHSVNMINIGFDCHVVCKKEEIGAKKWVPRKMAYIFSLVLTLIRKPGVKMKLSRDGEEYKDKQLLLTTFANGAFCGGGFYSNPRASLTDGKIDCIEVKNIGRLKFVSLVGSYKKGEHLVPKFKNIIENLKSHTVDILFDEETHVSVDGEIIRTKELHLSVDRKALKFLLPAGVRVKIQEIKAELTKEAVTV